MYSLFQVNMSIFKTKIIYFNRVKLTTVDLVLKTNDNNMKGGSTSVLYSTYRINGICVTENDIKLNVRRVFSYLIIIL